MAQAKRNKKLRIGRRSIPGASVSALMTAALAIPGIATSESAATTPMVRFKYAYYKDYQPGNDRMMVGAPMAWFKTPLGQHADLEASGVYDAISGASPYYLDTLTGASGLGIHDHRRAGDAKATYYFERFSIGVGGTYSDEDDYTSRGGQLQASIWTEDKNTTVNFGAGINSDSVSSTNNTELDENKRGQNYFAGISQVLTDRSMVQSNLSVTVEDGYLTDPYKILDNRPASRDEYAWLTRYVLYFPETDGSLHADYRFYWDSWDIASHMLELAWYQQLPGSWMLRPNLRYYTQDSASFFTSQFPPDSFDGQFLSADQRVGAFGSVTTGLKVIKELSHGFSIDAEFDFITQNPNLRLGGSGSENIPPLFAQIFYVGIGKTF